MTRSEEFWRGETWPNLFIAGAAKAGTTSLYAMLGRSPGFYCPSMKEPHFFSSVPPLEEGAGYVPTVRDSNTYRKLYSPGASYRYRVDASTSYLWNTESAERIRQTCPRDTRVIILLRDPVQRSYSHYLNNASEGWERRSFAEALEDELEAGETCRWNDAYIAGSRYSRQLPAFAEVFGANLWVGFSEELRSSPHRFFSDLSAFLGADLSSTIADYREEKNSYSIPRNDVFLRLFHSPRMRAASRQVLPAAARGRLRTAVLKPARKPPLGRADERLLLRELRGEYNAIPELLYRPTPWRVREIQRAGRHRDRRR